MNENAVKVKMPFQSLEMLEHHHFIDLSLQTK
jgi:hypothetical protein